VSTTTDPLERLRAIISAWPETREKLSHGAPHGGAAAGDRQARCRQD
jgi:hypothetical protein